MARQLSWSDVRGGLLALVVIVVGAASIMVFLRVGALHGDTMRIYALVSEARGLTPGSEVWLSGQKVGKVTRIQFRPAATADTSTRLLIEMQLLSRYRNAINHDATAQIRAGGTIIGAVVVYLTPGSARSVPIAEGDTLLAQAQPDVEGAGGQLGAAPTQVKEIMDNLKVLSTGLQSTRGTAGAILNGQGLAKLGETRIRAVHLAGRLQGGGTVGLVMRGGLTARAGTVMARVDSVRALLASSNTSLGRFRRDSTLATNVADIRDQLARVQRELDAPSGTAGRVLRDSALTRGLATAQQEMTLLFADLKKHPFRYISF